MLIQLREARPGVEIETIEILHQPARALLAGIWMIPALIVGEEKYLRMPALNDLLQAVDAAASND